MWMFPWCIKMQPNFNITNLMAACQKYINFIKASQLRIHVTHRCRIYTCTRVCSYAEYIHVHMCVFKHVTMGVSFLILCVRKLYEKSVRKAMASLAQTHTTADLWVGTFFPTPYPNSPELLQGWNGKTWTWAVCSLHSCPQWGRQEMPASSQESLL